MEAAEYRLVYYTILLLTALICYFSKIFRITERKYTLANIIAGFLIIIIPYLVYDRALDVGTDTLNYYYMFNASHREIDWSISRLLLGDEPVFSALIILVSQFGEYNLFFFVTCLIMNLAYYRASFLFSRKLGISPIWTFLFVLSTFTCWSQQINVIRSGLAISIALISIFYIFEGKTIRAVISGFLAVGCHVSVLIFIVFAIIVKFAKKINLKKYNIAYIAVIYASFVGVGLLGVINRYAPQMAIIDRYAIDGESESYQTGFRLSFVLYNTAFLILFLYLKLNRLGTILPWLKLFSAMSMVFFLCFTIPYSDRIGAFSWMLIPLLTSSLYKVRNRYSPLIFFPYLIINFLI